MNLRTVLPRPSFNLLFASSIFLAAGSGISIAAAAPDSDACALLSPADLTTLLGGTPVASSNGTACRWTASSSGRKLVVSVVQLKTPGVTAEMAFSGARQGAAKDGEGTVSDEAGIGEKAFASLESFGVALMALKQGRLLQLQYWTEAAGTAKDLFALRPVARKAIAAL